MRRRTQLRLASGAAAALTLAAFAPGWAGGENGVHFGKPVLLTPPNAGGYEPGVYADRFGNLYSTAHKENWELAVAPDSRSTTQTRSQSWAWYSSNGGATWKDLPEGPGDLYNHMFGDEGDMALDDANNLYMVDTDVTDITLTAWHVGNNGPVFDHANPLPGMAEPTDDRPWVAAHLNGHVFYFGNEGDRQTYPLGNQHAGSGTGPGRYTVYKSTDGGATFDHLGITLKASGWCRPAAAPHSPYVYAFCTDDHGTLYSYVSANDGKTWSRYKVGSYHANDPWSSWPTLQVMPDGTLWASYLDHTRIVKDVNGYTDPTTSKVLLFHSTDHGKHWKKYDATPAGAASKWQYDYLWVATAPNGHTLGMAIYGRPFDYSKGNTQQPVGFKVYSAIFEPGQHPNLISLDPKHPVTPATFDAAPGDFLMSTFDSYGKLHVTWTRVITSADAPEPVGHVTSVMRYIYAANQQ
jgi:hypothetical protein